jgi:hypothetical protein
MCSLITKNQAYQLIFFLSLFRQTTTTTTGPTRYRRPACLGFEREQRRRRGPQVGRSKRTVTAKHGCTSVASGNSLAGKKMQNLVTILPFHVKLQSELPGLIEKTYEITK